MQIYYTKYIQSNRLFSLILKRHNLQQTLSGLFLDKGITAWSVLFLLYHTDL